MNPEATERRLDRVEAPGLRPYEGGSESAPGSGGRSVVMGDPPGGPPAEGLLDVLAAKILEAYRSKASTGTRGAEIVRLYHEAEEEIRRDPESRTAGEKLRRALAMTEEIVGENGVDE